MNIFLCKNGSHQEKEVTFIPPRINEIKLKRILYYDLVKKMKQQAEDIEYLRKFLLNRNEILFTDTLL